MRAMVLTGQGTPLQLQDIPVPEVQQGELLIRVSSCGICRTDLHVLDGDLKEPVLPLVPGHQIVGSVASIGAGVNDFTVGQRVGVPWLGGSCGKCDYCRDGRENLCDQAVYTGYQSEALLEQAAELHFGRPLSDFMGPGREVCNRSEGAVSELRTMLHSLSINVSRWSGAHRGPASGPELVALEEKLAELVLKCLERGEVKPADRKLSRRMAALRAVLATIEDTPIEVVNLPEILKQVDVSRRTIEHAFQDRFDVSPAAYIKALRLKALNRTLLVGDKRELSVREICQRYGFRHLGQLANDYNKLFGELPSVTLRRDAP